MNRLFIISAVLILTAISTGVTNRQVIKTSLQITVIDDLGNFVEGAVVQLYKNEEDYRNETNQVTEEKQTDVKGRVKFKDLNSGVYFILVRKGDLTNIGGGVQTELAAKKVNKVNIVIE